VRRALVLNAGSSSFKWSLLDAATEAVEGEGNDRWREGAEPAQQVLETLHRLPGSEAIDAVGHRLVHGGSRFRATVRIDAEARRDLAALAELDPLHTARAIAGIDAAFAAFPGLPQIAAFDTGFHGTLPDESAFYPVPWEWTEKYGLRRYGFHGLSVAYAARRAGELLGASPERLIVCHLGSGCSVSAVRAGRSLDTSMGFTPLEGVMMATRSGTVDPGLLLYLLKDHGISVAELDEALNRRSGLLGVSGISADFREVLAATDAAEAGEVGARRARLAYAMFLHRLKRMVGAMMGVLSGLDALLFTGGIGEGSARLRRDVAAAFAFAGLELDLRKNEAAPGDADVASAGSKVRALVVTAREDLTILREMRRLLG